MIKAQCFNCIATEDGLLSAFQQLKMVYFWHFSTLNMLALLIASAANLLTQLKSRPLSQLKMLQSASTPRSASPELCTRFKFIGTSFCAALK